MKNSKKLVAMGLACAMVMGSAMNVAAADVSVKEGGTEVGQTTVSLVKENPAPTFTVGIPATVSMTSADPAQLTFTMNEESLNAIPDGKKVSVSIADAGYGNTTGKFALSSGTEEATYGVYGSKYSTRPSDAYEIGDLLVSFYGNEKVTDGVASIGRVVKADDYEGISAGTYEGFITFNIDVRNQ